MSSTILKGLSVLLIAIAAIVANAGELDSENGITNKQAQIAESLPGSVIVRVEQATGRVAVLHADQKLETDAASVSQVVNSKEFVQMDVKGNMTGELDRDSSRSSWYFCFNNWSWGYPTYYAYGYSFAYTNYYWNNWGGYSYYWYYWRY
jgi:hypothetical protein